MFEEGDLVYLTKESQENLRLVVTDKELEEAWYVDSISLDINDKDIHVEGIYGTIVIVTEKDITREMPQKKISIETVLNDLERELKGLPSREELKAQRAKKIEEERAKTLEDKIKEEDIAADKRASGSTSMWTTLKNILGK